MASKIIRTGVERTYAAWNDAATFPKSGDFVDIEFQAHFYECVPPITFTSTLIQMGEPHDHAGFAGRARFHTIQRSGLLWVYTGIQERGYHVEIV